MRPGPLRHLLTALPLCAPRRLDERERRRGFVLERGLLNTRAAGVLEKKRNTQEKELYARMRVFARYQVRASGPGWLTPRRRRRREAPFFPRFKDKDNYLTSARAFPVPISLQLRRLRSLDLRSKLSAPQGSHSPRSVACPAATSTHVIHRLPVILAAVSSIPPPVPAPWSPATAPGGARRARGGAAAGGPYAHPDSGAQGIPPKRHPDVRGRGGAAGWVGAGRGARGLVCGQEGPWQRVCAVSSPPR